MEITVNPNQTGEDLNVTSSDVPRQSEALNKYVLNCFTAAYKYTEMQAKEISSLREMYANKEPVDYYNQACKDEEEEKKLYRTGLLSNLVCLRSAVQSDSKPRVYFDPILKPEAEELFQTMQQSNLLPKWVMDKAQNAGSFPDFINNTLDSIFDRWWKTHGTRNSIYRLNKEGVLTGYGIVKVRYNQKKTSIILDDLKFETVCWDAEARRKDEIRYIFHIIPKHTRDIEREYKLRKGTIKAEEDISEKNMAVTLSSNPDAPDETRYLTPKARLVEGYFQDKDSEKFPNGRKIVFVLGQGEGKTPKESMKDIRVVEDIPWKYGSFPIFFYVVEGETETRGKPIARDLASMQVIGDLAMQMGISNFGMVGMCKVLYREGALADVGDITNQIGKKIRVADPNGVQFLPPVPVLNESLSLTQSVQTNAVQLSGLTELSGTRNPGSINSSKALIAEQELVSRRMRPASRAFEEFLVDVFSFWVELFIDTTPSGYKVYYGNTDRVGRKLPFAMKTFVDGVDITVGEDSSVPKDVQSQTNIKMQLASTQFEDGMPGIDRQSLLEALDIENKTQIIQRIEAQKNVNQVVQQLQQQNQQMQQGLQQAQKSIQELSSELQNSQVQLQSGAYKAQIDMQKLLLDIQARLKREEMRQDGNIERAQVTHEQGVERIAHQSRAKMAQDTNQAVLDSLLQSQQNTNQNTPGGQGTGESGQTA